ncbi:MAG: hypothetical protein GX879_01770 [Bacteroidales bacterium]|nr:hypothetical protein [Bacteroidales bacterium]
MKTNVLITVLFFLLIGFSSCIQEKFDEPPLNVIPEGNILTISEVRQIYTDSVLLAAANTETYKFTDDFSVFGIITMDDKSGNIYKTAYVQDETGAINLRLLSPGGVYEGDSVRVYLKGLVLSSYERMLQLDSVNVDKNIIKQSTLHKTEPKEITIGELKTGNYQAQLIKIDNVQFVGNDAGKQYADPIGLNTVNRTIEDCDGNTLIVRTSGYASFAGQNTPEGRGSIIAIAGQFRDDWQLYIRRTEEVKFDNLRCGEYNAIFEEDFASVEHNKKIEISGWKNIASVGDSVWVGQNNGINTSAKITGIGNSEAWLITPKIEIKNPEFTYLKFSTRALSLYGANLKVYVSKNYDGGSNPDNSTWEEINANIASSTSTTNSGNIDLSSYSGNINIAFKYSGLSGNKGVFYLDNLIVFEE